MTDSPRKRVRDAHQAIYRETILDGAERVFGEHGYDGTKVQAIAAEAGVSLATLYSVFGKKWALYCALHARRLGELMERTFAAIQDATDPAERMRLGIRSYLLYHMERPDYLRIQLRDGLAWSLSDVRRTPEQDQAFTTGFPLLVEACRAGIERGLLIDEDPELIARTALAMHQVRLALWIDRGMTADPDDVVDEVERLFQRTFFNESPTP